MGVVEGLIFMVWDVHFRIRYPRLDIGVNPQLVDHVVCLDQSDRLSVPQGGQIDPLPYSIFFSQTC